MTASHSPPWSVALDADGAQLVLRLVGELDCSARPDLDAAVLAAAAQHGLAGIVVDLRDVTFLDCGVLTFLVRLSRLRHPYGDRVVLLGPTQFARRILDLGGVSSLLDIREDSRIPGPRASARPDHHRAVGREAPMPYDAREVRAGPSSRLGE